MSDRYYELFKRYESYFEKYGYYNKQSYSDYNYDSNISSKNYKFISPNDFKILMLQTNISNKEKIIVNKTYIGSVFSWHLNSKLRNSETLDTKEKLVKDTLKMIINKNKLRNNYLCKRYTKFDYIEKVFRINPSKLSDYTLKNELNKHIGSIKEEKGFMSCTMTKNQIITGPCLLYVYAKAGIKAFITDNVKETEIILDCNTKYKILKIEVNSSGYIKIVLHVLIL